MPRSRAGRQARINKLKDRIASSKNDHFPRCLIWEGDGPCGRSTARAARKGLSASMCRYHQQRQQRHGSPFCKSPTAEALRPYVMSALSYFEIHRTDLYINAALNALVGLMETAGSVEMATRLRGMAPERRARIALARLRERNVKPERLLAIGVAVAALSEDAPEAVHRTQEYFSVAVAKAAHRLASGTHRRWELNDTQGKVISVTEMHAYPRSSGRVLRHLGEMIKSECEWVIEYHLAHVLALKVARYGHHKAGA